MANLLRKIDENEVMDEEEEEIEEPILEEGGELSLDILGAKLSRDTDFFGKMDPYCILTYLGREMRTKTHNKGGVEPIWNDHFDLDVGHHNTEIHLSVWDDDIGSDDLIGECKIPI